MVNAVASPRLGDGENTLVVVELSGSLLYLVPAAWYYGNRGGSGSRG